MAKRNWTPEQRRTQGEKIRHWKPWQKSTGPRTTAGKQKTRLNALWEKYYDFEQATSAIECHKRAAQEARDNGLKYRYKVKYTNKILN